MTEGLRLTIGGGEEFEVVGVASDGAEAVELCRKLKPDIVTLDITMPVMDGLGALDMIIEEDPECNSDKYAILWRRLCELRKTNINWGVIS